MNGYLAFYKDEKIEVYAETSYKAQCKAAEVLRVKPNRQYMITVALCEKDGEPVLHSPAEFS